MTIKRRCF